MAHDAGLSSRLAPLVLMMLMLLLPRPRRSPLYHIFRSPSPRRLHHVAFTTSPSPRRLHRVPPVAQLRRTCLPSRTASTGTRPGLDLSGRRHPVHHSAIHSTSSPIPNQTSSLATYPSPSLQLDNLQARANLTSTSRTLASADEAERRAKALREIEDDRDQVRDRVNRERRMRDREERLAREQAEQAAWSAHADAEGGAGTGSGSGGQPEWFGEDGHDDDEMDQEDEMVLQGGRRLDS
jgi:hypothetical protein